MEQRSQALIISIFMWLYITLEAQFWEQNLYNYVYTVMRRITTFRSTTDRIYDVGPIILYYNIIILTTVLQLPTVFSTVTCCTGFIYVESSERHN